MKRTGVRVAAGVCAAGLAWSAAGQDLGLKPGVPQKETWIVGATVHTVSGAVLEGASVRLDRAGTIAEVTTSSVAADAALFTVVDARGKHVYPGMIGANTQSGLIEVGAVRATLDYAETGAVTPEVRAAVAVNPDSTLLPVTRSNGVLTVGVLPLGGAIPGRASVIRLDGWTWEDMAVDDDAGVVVNWPTMRPTRGWWVTKSIEDQEKERREALAQIDTAFATARAYLAARGAGQAGPTDVRWEAMRGVLEKGDRVFVRAEELEQIQSATAWAVRHGLKLVIVGGRDAWMPTAIESIKQADAGVIIAGTHRLPRRNDSDFDESFTLPMRLEEAGVRWALASAGGPFETPHERNLPYHAATAVAYGLGREAALRSITLSAAELLGVGDRLGSVEVGKEATLIVTDGDPLEITTKVERAFIRGREIDLENKQTALEKKYREKYRQQE
ncbi:MAG: amidohydrolase family protein [Planctomycetota bacterium]|nr:amidohydrolase family protein [Planctomycetota bacterium]